MAETKLKSQQAFQSNGWERIPGTLTYASASTINTSQDLTGIIGIGDKLKLNNTSTKYFIVTAITASLITVTAGTTYTVANSAISEAFYSKVANPLGFPATFSYTVVVASSGGTTPTFQNYNGVFWTIGRTCHVTISVNGTGVAGSGAYDTTFSIPIDCAVSGGYNLGAGQYATDAVQDILHVWNIGSSKLFCRKKNIYTTLQNSDLAFTTTRYINIEASYAF